MLDVQHLARVPAAVRGQRATGLDAQGQFRVRGDESGESLAVRLPVETAFGVLVVHRHAAPDVHLGKAQAVARGEFRRPGDDALGHREVFGGVQAVGQVGVDAAQFEVRVAAVGEQADDRVRLRRVEAGGTAATAAVGEQAVGHREIEARQDRQPTVRSVPLSQPGQHVQLVLALHEEACHAPLQRVQELRRGLVPAAEGQRVVRRRPGDVVQFAVGGDLVAVDVRGERGQDLRLLVGLGRVVQLDTLGQRGPHRRGVCAQCRQVVHISGKFRGRQGQDAIAHRE